MSKQNKKSVYEVDSSSEEEEQQVVHDNDEDEDGTSNENGKISSSCSESGQNVENNKPGPITQHRISLFKAINTNFHKHVHPTEPQSDLNFDISTKLALINILKEINTRRTSTYKIATKYLDWSKVNIPGHTLEELKECFKQIMSSVCSVRTLDEMLNDYSEHYRKYELKNNPNAPKLPTNPCMRYVAEHRKELTNKLQAKHPNEKITLGMISKYGAKRFRKLPENERKYYEDQYKALLQVFHKEKEELIRNNPELKLKRKKSAPSKTGSKINAEKPNKIEKEEIITPFKIFYKEVKENGTRFHDAQQMYKNLEDAEKLKYINKVFTLETDLDKVFTIEEKKIMKNQSKLPPRPLSAYNAFVKSKTINQKLSIKAVSEMWKNLDDDEKKAWNDKQNVEIEKWKANMMEQIKKLPADQQAEYMFKYSLFKQPAKRKRDNNTSFNGNEENDVQKYELSTPESTPKKKKKNNEILSPVADTSSPKKENIEKALNKFGPYPSLTTAHYFMTTRCVGKTAKKVSKLYKALPKSEKKKLFNEMSKIKNNYLAKVKSYAEKVDPKDLSKILDFHKANKTEQESNLAWYKSSNTDEDDSEDSDEDSDDSDDS